MYVLIMESEESKKGKTSIGNRCLSGAEGNYIITVYPCLMVPDGIHRLYLHKNECCSPHLTSKAPTIFESNKNII